MKNESQSNHMTSASQFGGDSIIATGFLTFLQGAQSCWPLAKVSNKASTYPEAFGARKPAALDHAGGRKGAVK